MNAESVSWLIKRLEPRMRELGKTFSWDKVNAEILSGSDLSKLALESTTSEEIDEVISRFADAQTPYLAGNEREQNERDIRDWGGSSYAPSTQENAPDKQQSNPNMSRKIL